jgi:hypothetical protein
MRKLVLLVMMIAACGKDDASASGSGGSAGGAPAAGNKGPRETLVETWKANGLAPSAFAPANVAFGKDCATGTVNNVDVLVCVFGSAAEAKAAAEQGNGWIGETAMTGASQAHGSLLVVAADRKKADANGKTIQNLMALAPK